MPKINEIQYAQELIEKCKEYAYAKLFPLVETENNFERFQDSPHLSMEERYKKELLTQLKYKQITDWSEDFSLPSENFCRFFDSNRKHEDDLIKEAFRQGDCITYKVMSVSDASWDRLYDKGRTIEKLGGRLVSYYSKFPMNNHTQLAFFSNGRFFIGRSANLGVYKKFRELMIRKGYPVQEPEEVSFDFLRKIDSYARQIYMKTVVEEPQPERLELINSLFEYDNICLTASKLMNSKAERRDYLAFFADGRLIVSDRYKDYYGNIELSSKVKEFISNCQNSDVVLVPQYVPHHYIDTIYKAAQSYNWYASCEEVKEYYATKRALKNQKKLSVEQKKDESSDVEMLFANNNICLTASAMFPSTIGERQTLALFEDGSFFVEYKRENDVYTQSLLSKLTQRGIKFNKPVIVERDFLNNVYKTASKYDWYVDCIDSYNIQDYKIDMTSEAFIDNLFKVGTKCLSVTDIDFALRTDKKVFALFDDGTLFINENHTFDGIVLSIEVLAKKKLLGKEIVKKYVPQSCLDNIYTKALEHQKSCKDIYIEILKKQAKQIAKTDDIPHHQALELVAVYNDFANWQQVCEVEEGLARRLISELKEKAIYMKMFNGQAENLSLSEGISLLQAQARVAEKQRFADWRSLENASYAKLMARI